MPLTLPPVADLGIIQTSAPNPHVAGQAITYTNNWPHEPLIDNRPTAANVLWSIVSVVLLLARDVPSPMAPPSAPVLMGSRWP